MCLDEVISCYRFVSKDLGFTVLQSFFVILSLNLHPNFNSVRQAVYMALEMLAYFG